MQFNLKEALTVRSEAFSDIIKDFGFPDTVDGVKDIAPLVRHTYKTSVTNGGAIIAHHTARFTMDGGSCLVDGEGSVVVACDNAQIHGAKITVIGKRNLVVIGPFARPRRVDIRLEGDDCVFLLGAESTWESGLALVTHSRVMAVGKDCMISSGVVVRTADGHGIYNKETKEHLNNPGDVVVGDHVWIGSGVRLSKGVKIHHGSVIGQEAVVTKDIEPNTINVGIPARTVNTGIVWSRTGSYEDIPETYR